METSAYNLMDIKLTDFTIKYQNISIKKEVRI